VTAGARFQGVDETICLLRSGTGLDLSRYVVRTFCTATGAHEYENTCGRQVTIVRLPGKWKAGDQVPHTTRGRTLT
jgi:hypothetical protein